MATWEKAFDTFQWENRSQSTNTPLDATHLNKVNDALDVIDDRVIELQGADADMEEEIAGKQDALTFDDVPTDGSNNPVKSNGIYDALNGKVDKNGTDRLMTAAEGTKLAGIAAGAQVNVLEGVVVDSVVQPISGKKAFIDLSGKTDLSVIAYTFNSEMGYFKGAYVTYNGKLYEFIQEHTGAWNPSHVREIRASGQYVRTGNGGYNNGDRATCEGYMTKASGNYSHAEGRETQAVGECTHAEGRETIANSIYQHVEGKYNIADNESKYIHIIGNGIDDNNRSNAMTLDWNGNLAVSGDVEDGNGEKISDKTDKVTNATSGNLAGLDSNGNLTDSGVSPTEDVTVEGNPVTFESPFEQDAKSVVVSVKPIQDLHGYDKPWVGGAGKNKLPLTVSILKSINTTGTWNGNTYNRNGVSCEVLTDESNENVHGIKVTGTASNNVWFGITPNTTDVSANTILSGCPASGSGGTYCIRMLQSDDTTLVGDDFGSGLSISSAYNDVNLYIRIASGYACPSGGLTFYPMIRFATESDATFVPYSNICPISGIDEVEIGVSDGESTPTTTTIPLPSTLYDADVDVTEGSAVEPLKMVDLGSLNWHYDESNRRFYSDTIPDAYLNADNESRTGFCMCSDYETFWHHENFDANWNSVAYVAWWEHNPNHIFMVHDHRYTDATAFKNAVSGVQFLYQITTPTTLSFDPTNLELLEGTNVVSTNAEKVAVTYGRSLWQDIDDLKTDTEGKLNKSDVATIEGDTASRPYSVNEFMLRADGLYKVTAPIASGASITASNTTKTTIGAVLTALLNA